MTAHVRSFSESLPEVSEHAHVRVRTHGFIACQVRSSDILRAHVTWAMSEILKLLSLRPRPSVPGSWSYKMDHRELTPKD